LANFQTILVQSTDRAVIGATSRALSEADGYRVVYCEDDRTAIRRLDEIQVNLFLHDCGGAAMQGDSALEHSRLVHTACTRFLLFDRDRSAAGHELANRTASFQFLYKSVEALQLSLWPSARWSRRSFRGATASSAAN
jgi:two-component system response regulator HupR/HoxA